MMLVYRTYSPLRSSAIGLYYLGSVIWLFDTIDRHGLVPNPDVWYIVQVSSVGAVLAAIDYVALRKFVSAPVIRDERMAKFIEPWRPPSLLRYAVFTAIPALVPVVLSWLLMLLLFI